MAVTFTRRSPGTYTPTTGRFATSSTSTITGRAIRVSGDPKQYRQLEIIESEAITLLFTPESYEADNLPAIGDEIEWAEKVYRVRAISPVDLDGGGAVTSRIVCSR